MAGQGVRMKKDKIPKLLLIPTELFKEIFNIINKKWK